MSTVIYKYSILEPVIVPAEAKTIHVGPDPKGGLCVWLEIPLNALPSVPRKFVVIGTGDPVPEGGVHVGSWVDGQFVWHAYELT